MRGMATIRAQLRHVGQARPVHAGGRRRAAWRAFARRSATTAVDAADLVIEAVFENMALKKQIFADARRAWRSRRHPRDEHVDARHRRDRVGDQRGPAQVIGLHFFSPANVMRLVEIVRGAATSPDGRRDGARARQAARQGRRRRRQRARVRRQPDDVPVHVRGAVPRRGRGDAGAGRSRARPTAGMAMGIFAVDDMAGLDVAWRVRQELGPVRGARRAQAARRRPAVRDGPLRPEDRQGLVPLRRGPQADSRSRGAWR